MPDIKRYRCTHYVEAMQWNDTDAEREAFAAWFEKHDAVFGTFGPVVVLPDNGVVHKGEWIVFMDGDFIAMDAEQFAETYEVCS